MKSVKIALAMSAAALVSIGLFAQEQPTTMPAASPAEQGMMANCKGMMAHHEQMQTEMKGMDAKLEQLIAKIDEAQGDKKIDAMTAVIKEMASQRTEMREKMAMMGPSMCMHMNQHMGSMADCPMMKGMMKGKEGMKGMEGMKDMKSGPESSDSTKGAGAP